MGQERKGEAETRRRETVALRGLRAQPVEKHRGSAPPTFQSQGPGLLIISRAW